MGVVSTEYALPFCPTLAVLIALQSGSCIVSHLASRCNPKAGVTRGLPQPDLLCDGAPPCTPWLLLLPPEGKLGVTWRESASLSTWAEPAEGCLFPWTELTAVLWLALKAALLDVADLGFCSVPDCALAPEAVGALD